MTCLLYHGTWTPCPKLVSSAFPPKPLASPRAELVVWELVLVVCRVLRDPNFPFAVFMPDLPQHLSHVFFSFLDYLKNRCIWVGEVAFLGLKIDGFRLNLARVIQRHLFSRRTPSIGACAGMGMCCFPLHPGGQGTQTPACFEDLVSLAGRWSRRRSCTDASSACGQKAELS